MVHTIHAQTISIHAFTLMMRTAVAFLQGSGQKGSMSIGAMEGEALVGKEGVPGEQERICWMS